jgi:hypothetical protein
MTELGNHGILLYAKLLICLRLDFQFLYDKTINGGIEAEEVGWFGGRRGERKSVMSCASGSLLFWFVF